MAGKSEQKIIDVKIKGVNDLLKLKRELKELKKQQEKTQFVTKKGAKDWVDKERAIAKATKKYRENRKELAKLNKEQKKGGEGVKSFGQNMLKTAVSITAVVTAVRFLSRVFTTVASTFSEFEFTMAKVLAVSGATDAEFKALTKTAEELGRTTFFTAEQVAQLQLSYSKLGFTAQEIQDAVKPTLALATATGTDLARSATVAGAAVRGFGLDASETERVVDVMAVTFASSAMDIEKWQTSMTKVAPIAKSAGFSIEDTAAMMSKLTDAGIEASIAGTSMRNILLKMQDPTSELSMRFGKTIHSLDDLVPAMKKFVKEGGSMADVMEVVDLRQAAAFEQLITSADGTLDLRDALLAANGEGQRMADIIGNTMQGAFLKFKSALQGLSISLMKNYAPALQKAMERTAKFFNKLASDENIGKITKTLKVIKNITIALGAYKIGIIAVSAAQKIGTAGAAAWTKIMGGAKVATEAMTVSLVKFRAALARTGLGLLVIGLADLTVSLASFNKKSKEATKWLKDLDDKTSTNEKSVNALETSLNRLVKARKTIDKYTKDDIKNIDKNSLEYAKYSKQLVIATQETNTLNSAFKSNGLDLIDLQTDIENTKIKFSELAKQMRNTAAVAVLSKMTGEIIETKMTADTVLAELIETFEETGQDLSEIDILDKAGDMSRQGGFRTWIRDVKNNLTTFFGGQERDWETIAKAIDDAGLSLGDFTKYADSVFGENEMNKDLDALHKRIKLLYPDFEAYIKLQRGGGEEEDKGSTTATNWANEMTEALNAVKKKREELTISEKEYNKQLLSARKTVIERELKEGKLKVARKLQLEGQLSDIEIKQNQETFKEKALIEKTAFNNKKGMIEQDAIDKKDTALQTNRRLLELEKAHLKKMLALRKLYGEDVKDIEEAIAKNKQNLNKQEKAELKEVTDFALDLATTAADAAFQIMGNNLQREKEAAEKSISDRFEWETSVLDRQLKEKSITQAQYDGQKQIKEKERRTKEQELAKEMANKEKTMAIAQATVNGALAITAALTNPYAAPFVIPMIIATTAAQIGIINSQQFAQGGMVEGKSHAQGGEKFAVGGRVVELEGGEAVINKRSTSMFRSQLSAMNTAGGGVKFADGGLLNSGSFNAVKFDSAQFNQSSGGGKVVVVESDITNSQNKVKAIQTNASF